MAVTSRLPFIRSLAIGLVAVVLTSCTSDGAEIMSYPLLCDAPVVRGDCSGKITPLNRTTYKVFPGSQQVVYWIPGISDRPVRLEQCVVRTAEHWKCRIPRRQGAVEFSNGVFKEMLTKPRLQEDRFFYVGATRW